MFTRFVRSTAAAAPTIEISLFLALSEHFYCPTDIYIPIACLNSVLFSFLFLSTCSLTRHLFILILFRLFIFQFLPSFWFSISVSFISSNLTVCIWCLSSPRRAYSFTHFSYWRKSGCYLMCFYSLDLFFVSNHQLIWLIDFICQILFFNIIIAIFCLMLMHSNSC